MKNKIDLTDPSLKPIINSIRKKMYMALDVTLEMETSIFPIYDLLKKNKPEQTGSGVLVKIKTDFFIFSASHIFDSIGSKQLLIGIGKGRKLLSLPGERFSTKRGKSGTHEDDLIDASVYHIKTDLPDDVKERALSYSNLDVSENEHNSDTYVMAGYRIKKSYSIGNKAYGMAEAFPSVRLSLEYYSSLNLNKEEHVALAYEKYTLINGQMQKTPKLVGLSGGGMIRVKEILIPGSLKLEKALTPLLSAITTQYMPERHNKEGAVIGVRVLVHLSLIEKYLPNLLLQQL